MGDLTPRELEILQLASVGLTNKQIALECEVGMGTVKTHVRHILLKLGAPTRTGAIHAAYQRGLLVPPVPEAVVRTPVGVHIPSRFSEPAGRSATAS